MNQHTRPILAIEGPSLAGKTTLTKGLAKRFTENGLSLIPCYVEAAPQKSLPRLNIDAREEQHEAIRFFLTIEQLRYDVAVRSANAPIVVLDRSVDTLLAHTFALDELHGIDALHGARALAEEAACTMRPDLTLYLDVPGQVLRQRAQTRRDFPDFLICDDFLRHFRHFFELNDMVLTHRVEVLDGTQSPDSIVAITADWIETLWGLGAGTF